MNKFICLTFFALLLSACKAPTTPEAIGEHNLSKGRCVDIAMCDANGQCDSVRDESVQYVCQMIGGRFEARELPSRGLF